MNKEIVVTLEASVIKLLAEHAEVEVVDLFSHIKDITIKGTDRTITLFFKLLRFNKVVPEGYQLNFVHIEEGKVSVQYAYEDYNFLLGNIRYEAEL